MSRSILVLVALFIILSACGKDNEFTPTPTVIPIPSPIPTPTFTPSPSPTPTLTPSPSPTPTFTPIPSPIVNGEKELKGPTVRFDYVMEESPLIRVRPVGSYNIIDWPRVTIFEGGQTTIIYGVTIEDVEGRIYKLWSEESAYTQGELITPKTVQGGTEVGPLKQGPNAIDRKDVSASGTMN